MLYRQSGYIEQRASKLRLLDIGGEILFVGRGEKIEEAVRAGSGGLRCVPSAERADSSVLVEPFGQSFKIRIVEERHDAALQIARAQFEKRIDRLDGSAGEQANREEPEYDSRRDIKDRRAVSANTSASE
jgi:hypothetical protein